MAIRDLEPIRFATLTDDDLRRLISGLWQRRASGNAWTRYGDGGGSGTKPDAELATAIAALERELARRAGIHRINTVRVAATKGLETP